MRYSAHLSDETSQADLSLADAIASCRADLVRAADGQVATVRDDGGTVVRSYQVDSRGIVRCVYRMR